ncbi:hypothetical protein BX589_10138 [Paraburkholderia fungorum]|jgi:hypothetical protein|uniref:hypothetical protein n=1 Tax=Paraburkholderia fungorum TaxID=134537 RepID=UPI000D07F8F0|nr:hypothetical protein [Paraburkholderia fungorum]PRZ56388.1 hypothetical protein BX589_10138 [Paraburkholderia fungorum]
MNAHTASRSLLLIALTATLTLSLEGCETIANTTAGVGHAFGVQNDKVAAGVGGGIFGCAGGAVIGLFTSGGAGGALKGCAIGGAAGAAVGVASVYRQQLNAAKALQAQAAADKSAKVVIETKAAPAGAQDQGERASLVKADIPNASIDARNPQVAEIAQKVSKIAAMNPEGGTIQVSGTAAHRAWLEEQVRASLPPDAKVKVVDVASSQSSIAFTPAMA